VNFHFPPSGNNEKKIDWLRRINLSSKEKNFNVPVAEEMEKWKNRREVCQPGCKKDG
jgi:hypothetical protein